MSAGRESRLRSLLRLLYEGLVAYGYSAYCLAPPRPDAVESPAPRPAFRWTTWDIRELLESENG